jgi:hypothetical protein
MHNINVNLGNILDMEETKARQRARDRIIKEGDINTCYFHAVANQRKRKTTIYNIEGPEGSADTTKAIIEVATKCYKELFKFKSRPNINIFANFSSEEEKLTDEENLVLEDKFTEEEIKKAVFESYSDGAPELDGLSFMFYQTFWDVIKGYLVEIFDDFHKGKLDLYELNFSLIIVIPKEKNVRTMNKFRPISLLNCSY